MSGSWISARDGDALLLAARQPLGEAVTAAGEADALPPRPARSPLLKCRQQQQQGACRRQQADDEPCSAIHIGWAAEPITILAKDTVSIDRHGPTV